jgi:diguanylate cyclase (GGDEF)-like protein
MRSFPDFPEARSLPLPLNRLVRLRPAHSWLLVLLCTDLAVLGDVLTGPSVWFGPVYLFAMCLATWCLGWRAGILTGLASMALTFAANGVTLYPYGSAELAWNFTVRFLALSIVIAVVAGARRAYIREWWLARTDPLTGALNRQAFFELGAGLAGVRSWRLLIYADLDGLKRINDVQGHAAGDSALRLYASAIRQAARRDDMFARLGGDEFLIFMSIRDEAAARAVASRLHERMNSLMDESGGQLRCSAGGLIVPPIEMEIDDLVRHADDLMYQAKMRGGCLQVDVARSDSRPARPGRARKAARAPLLGSANSGKPKSERRRKIEVLPASAKAAQA